MLLAFFVGMDIHSGFEENVVSKKKIKHNEWKKTEFSQILVKNVKFPHIGK